MTPVSWSDSTITIVVPPSATSGDVVVTVGSVPSNPLYYTVTEPGVDAPGISAIGPLSGPPGTLITIEGSHFGDSQGSSTVTFGGVTATPVSWSDEEIVVAVPAGAVSGPIVITVDNTASNGVWFTVEPPPPPPTLTAIDPSTITVGATRIWLRQSSSH